MCHFTFIPFLIMYTLYVPCTSHMVFTSTSLVILTVQVLEAVMLAYPITN